MHDTIERVVAGAFPGRRVEVLDARGVGLTPGVPRVVFRDAEDFEAALYEAGVDEPSGDSGRFGNRDVIQVYLKESTSPEYDDGGSFRRFVPCFVVEFALPTNEG